MHSLFLEMNATQFKTSGLTDSQVLSSREKFGKNSLDYKKESPFFDTLLRTIKDPMMILLLTAASIYFISGKVGDGLFLVVAIVFQTSISIFQYSRSKNALEKLKAYSQSKSKVIRNGQIVTIISSEIVIGDSLLVEEGKTIAADGIIFHSNDFSVNESILTGESFAVFKDKDSDNNKIYTGTSVASGLVIATVNAIANNTKLGKIGKSLKEINEEKTPLEIQIANFVKKMAVIGAVVFLIVWGINFWHSPVFLTSLLKSLTLAMSILPEEIPVAFTTFMALGAWRLIKMGIIVKQMKTVETLGSATVICTDKTGTLTENKMSLAKVYLLETNEIVDANSTKSDALQLIENAMWASEPIPFDPMEIALHQAYKESTKVDKRTEYSLVHEYPLAGKPPLMTHIFKDKKGTQIVAAKGAPEAIIQNSKVSDLDKKHISTALKSLASEGYRILAVGLSDFTGTNYPKNQDDLSFHFSGLLAFYDPPKKNIQKVLEDFYAAGISVKIITGDNAETTASIAKQVGFRGYDKSISGDELMKLNAKELKKCVMETAIFNRMFPEAKLKIIKALKESKQVVAMTGDGVNDAPALKAAHIGIAMGKKGTEIAKEAASLILIEDDLSKMVDAVAMGRKIYANLKKAIQYIISIHIPIILTVFIPLALGWVFPTIFSPVHIIFLEIIMGPTCSIIYENEPMEKNTMTLKPKALTTTFFNWKELSTSIVQGLVITLGTLFVYQYSVMNNYNESLTRTMVFTVLIAANIFLTLINRSFYYSILTTMKYKNNMVVYIILITLSLLALLIYIAPIARFFEFKALNIWQLSLCFLIGFLSVTWFEIVKWRKRRT
ncbi:MAG: cation-translocating P-type ATPase [Fluviicola sp.]